MNRPLILILFMIIFLLIDWYAFQLVKTLFIHSSEQAQRTVKVVYWLFVAFAILGFLYYQLGNADSWGKHGKTFLRSALFVYYLTKIIWVLFLLIDDIQRLVQWIVSQLSQNESSTGSSGISRSEFLSKLGLFMAAIPFTSLIWGIVSGAHNYRVRRINVPVKNLPKALEGLRIGQLSDIHAGSFWDRKAVEQGIHLFEKESVDLALFTGDLVNNKATEMKNWQTLFSRIKAPLGTFSVLGNHDYGDYVRWPSEADKRDNLERLKTIQKEMGWQLLNNENRVLEVKGHKIGIIGVENWSAKGRFPKYGDLNKAMANLPDTAVNILLSHDPSHWQAEVNSASQNIALTLSGHTHGMQYGVEIPGIKWSPVQYIYKEWAGLYSQENQHLYVNRGFGYIGYPGRFGILPEITVLTLVSA